MTFLFRMAGRKRLDWRVYTLIGCVALLAAMLTGASWSAHGSSQERKSAAEWQLHTLEVLLESGDLKVAALSMVRGERGYLLTGDRTFLKPYESGLKDIEARLDRLAQLTRDNPQQQARIRRLEGEMQHLRDVLGTTIALEKAGRHAEAIAMVESGASKDATDQILGELRGIETIEHGLLALRSEDARAKAVPNERYQYALTIVGIALLILAASATVLIRRALAAEAEARRLLEQRASSDDMTGLSNRPAFMAALNRSVARSPTGARNSLTRFSISTGSNRSTTPTAILPAMRSSPKSPGAPSPRSAHAIWSDASGARNSA